MKVREAWWLLVRMDFLCDAFSKAGIAAEHAVYSMEALKAALEESKEPK